MGGAWPTLIEEMVPRVAHGAEISKHGFVLDLSLADAFQSGVGMGVFAVILFEHVGDSNVVDLPLPVMVVKVEVVVLLSKNSGDFSVVLVVLRQLLDLHRVLLHEVEPPLDLLHV